MQRDDNTDDSGNDGSNKTQVSWTADGVSCEFDAGTTSNAHVKRLCEIKILFRDGIDLGDYVWSINHRGAQWTTLPGNSQVAAIARTNPQAPSEAKIAISSYRASGAVLCDQARRTVSLMEEKLRAVVEWRQRLRDVRRDVSVLKKRTMIPGTSDI
ncbi:hypothetical protein Ct61P_15120 [Colletotrichum tofieldiae]|nr:hypothetical protein Ct61P_15120 [Colletotrichum tofieldiae]